MDDVLYRINSNNVLFLRQTNICKFQKILQARRFSLTTLAEDVHGCASFEHQRECCISVAWYRLDETLSIL